METALKIYEKKRKQLKAYQYAMAMIRWDSATEAPRGCFDDRSKILGELSEMAYLVSTSTEYVDCVNTLYANMSALDARMAHEIEVVKRRIDRMSKIPMNEYIEYSILMGKSQDIWAKAKHANDFEMFKPTLEKIINYKRKEVKYLESDALKGYNVLLDMFEPGFTTKEYDEFFNLLKEKLVPFFKQINNIKLEYNTDFIEKNYPKAKQIDFSTYLQDVLCFDRNHGLMKESEHPFTMGFISTDVRFTNHFYENDPVSAIFSTLHELGHALYGQQNDPELNDTFNGGGASNGVHESQSRFYENMIGRSKVFWETHFSKLHEYFPEQLADITVDDFYKHINRSEASYIRVDADELSYPLHIMLRYDIEKAIIDGNLSVDELEVKWNTLFKQYFGIEVPNASQGVLQDVHWSGGMIGYFPTYALGSAYSAQLYHYMAKELDIEKEIRTGKTNAINQWLKEKIHFHGATIYPKDLIIQATGEAFNPNYYIDYLINKYKAIYRIE